MPRMTPDQARSKQAEQLRNAVSKLRTSEGWQRWIRTRARFPRYSLRNTWLIAAQYPTATICRGYQQWRRDFNRQVRKGEKAIWILAPSRRVVRDEDDDDTGERRVFFRSVKVFDVSQTDQIPGLPEIPLEPPSAPITGRSHADWIEPLREHANALGCSVDFTDELPGDARGYYDPGEETIVVLATQPPNAIVRTLIHELAHAHGITYTKYPRAAAEVMAEAAAFIACGAIGLDTSGESVPYIAGWSESAEEVLTQATRDIDEIAKAISECRNAEASDRAPEAPDVAEPQIG